VTRLHRQKYLCYLSASKESDERLPVNLKIYGEPTRDLIVADSSQIKKRIFAEGRPVFRFSEAINRAES
jgi:hypothetical protein